MDNLHKRKCVPCEGGISKLTLKVSKEFQKQIPNWKIVKNHHILRTFKFKDFNSALNFVNKIGKIADTENHHPDIALSWGKVEVIIYTHAIKGLHPNDFILASKIDILK